MSLRTGSFLLRVRSRLLILASLFVLAGCSGLSLVYNRLDTLARFEAGRFVDLSPPQRAEFRQRFDALWGWHRRTQLPLYAQRLREAAALADAPVEPEALRALAGQARALALPLARRGVETFAPLVATLDEAQVGDLLADVRRRLDKDRHEQQRRSEDDWRREREEDAIDRLDHWAGSVTREQRARIRAWAADLQRGPDTDADEALALLQRALAERGRADYAAYLIADWIDAAAPADERRRDDTAGRAAEALLVDLSTLATPEQRRHLRQRLLALADELDELAVRR